MEDEEGDGNNLQEQIDASDDGEDLENEVSINLEDAIATAEEMNKQQM